MNRYPLQTLAARLGITLGEPGRPNDAAATHGRAAIAERCGIAVGSGYLQRCIDHGLTAYAADRYAVRCGYLPGEIWPDWDRGDDLDSDDDGALFDPPVDDLEPADDHRLAVLRAAYLRKLAGHPDVAA